MNAALYNLIKIYKQNSTSITIKRMYQNWSHVNIKHQYFLLMKLYSHINSYVNPDVYEIPSYV